MDDQGHIKTQFDDLLDGIKNGRGKPVSVHALAAASGLPAKDVLKWVEILEKDGKVKVRNSIGAAYVSWVHADSFSEHGSPPRAERKLDIDSAINVGTITPSPRTESSLGKDILIAQNNEEMVKMAKVTPLSAATADDYGGSAAPKATAPRIDSKAGVVGADGHIQKIGEMPPSVRQNEGAGGKAIHPEPEGGETQIPGACEEGDRDNDVHFARADAEKEASKLLSQLEANLTDTLQPPEDGAGTNNASKPVEAAGVPSTGGEQPEDEDVPERIGAEKDGRIAIEKDESIGAKKDEDSLEIGESTPAPRIGKIEASKPVKIAGVPVMFSERLSKHLKKIEAQTDKIKSLRAEKERLLNEQYAPIQRKLESELETVSDRILRMEKNIMEMQKRAIGMPEKIGAVDKMQLAMLKAHDEMRRAYDEASVLIDESNSALAEERDKIESIIEKGRQEIAQHRAKASELQGALEHISQMEEDSANKVSLAREALAEQAQQLAFAEKYSSDLRSLKSEIQENIAGLKESVSTTKGVLSEIERQMGQIRQIEEWSGSMREDYNKRIDELDDYIREGNREFETLRESVESNFVRKYLKELRSITNSYEYEFNEAKINEKGLDQRITEEKARLEELFEEGKKISRIFETQSSAPDGAGKFDARKETFDSLSELSKKRGEVEEMLVEVVGKTANPAPVEISRPLGRRNSAPSKKSRTKKKGRR